MARFSRRQGVALCLALLCVSASLVFAEDAAAEQPKQEDFQEKLAENEAAQEHGEEAPVKLESQIVDEAPKAELASGTGDVSTTGAALQGRHQSCLMGLGSHQYANEPTLNLPRARRRPLRSGHRQLLPGCQARREPYRGLPVQATRAGGERQR
jgi:hypothetical protein